MNCRELEQQEKIYHLHPISYFLTQTVPLRWQALGANSARKFRRVPCLAYLYGSVGDEREEEAKAAKVQSLKRNIWTEFFTTVNPNARLQE